MCVKSWTSSPRFVTLTLPVSFAHKPRIIHKWEMGLSPSPYEVLVNSQTLGRIRISYKNSTNCIYVLLRVDSLHIQIKYELALLVCTQDYS
jgi:hypothetical protein